MKLRITLSQVLVGRVQIRLVPASTCWGPDGYSWGGVSMYPPNGQLDSAAAGGGDIHGNQES